MLNYLVGDRVYYSYSVMVAVGTIVEVAEDYVVANMTELDCYKALPSKVTIERLDSLFKLSEVEYKDICDKRIITEDMVHSETNNVEKQQVVN